MKKLPTITKIGQAALLRLFKPHCIINAMEHSVCNVEFPKEECDLHQIIKLVKGGSHEMNIQANFSNGFMVWSIEIGRRALTVYEDDTILDAIGRLECLNNHSMPSHFIIRDFASDDISGDHETYTVYRLSQEQARHISNRSVERRVLIPHVVVEQLPLIKANGHRFGAEITFNGIETNGSGKTEDEARESAIRNWCNVFKKTA